MKSQCEECKHLRPLTGGCAAYPNGIPYKFSSGQELHDEIEKDQTSTFVFSPGEPEELKALSL